MKRLVFLGSAMVAVSVAVGDVVRNPVNVGMSLEEIQTFEPINTLDQAAAYSLPLLMVRPTGWIFGSATVDDRIDLVFGLGATLFSIPADSGQHPAGYQNEVYPAVAMVQATASYAFGDVKDPLLKVTIGQEPYKYNSSAKEYGEFLFRSTPYPNSVLNSPFDLVNAAQATVLGGVISKNFVGGKWTNDLLVTSANSSFPFGDLSLAYVTGFRINPVFEVGAGVNLFRLIPVQSDLTTYKGDPLNAYFTAANGKKYSTNSQFYNGASADSTLAKEVYDSLSNALFSNATPTLPAGVSGLDYFSLKGQMLMARFSLDLKPVLGDKMDLKVYGEWAMLGIQNQPVFYEKPVERMPLMIGINLPTWGLLNVLNVEFEYWKNPYFNSNYMAVYKGLATPNLAANAYNNAGLPLINDPVKDDDFKWAVSASKTFGKSFSLTAKAATDHLQVMQFHSNSFDRSYGDVMSGKKSWYYVLRAQVAI